MVGGDHRFAGTFLGWRSHHGLFVWRFPESPRTRFHASRSAISFAFALHNILSALSTPLVGRLIDRAGARKGDFRGNCHFRFRPASCSVCAATHRVPISVLLCHWPHGLLHISSS